MGSSWLLYEVLNVVIPSDLLKALITHFACIVLVGSKQFVTVVKLEISFLIPSTSVDDHLSKSRLRCIYRMVLMSK